MRCSPTSEPVLLPSPPVAAGAVVVLLEAGVPPADLRGAAGMCPEVHVGRGHRGHAPVPDGGGGRLGSDLPGMLRWLRPTLYFFAHAGCARPAPLR